jgi:nicotinamidase-related amidase
MEKHRRFLMVSTINSGVGMETGMIEKGKTAFLMVDVQEKFLPAVCGAEKLVKNANILLKGAGILGVPVFVTEQYPKGLGHTCAEIEMPEGKEVFEKCSFSCFGCRGLPEKLKEMGIKSIVLFGVESHVCILQTALDAMHRGLEVHVAEDAVSSRMEENRCIGIERMRQSGAFIASAEMVLFQLLKTSGSDEFKEISKLVK